MYRIVGISRCTRNCARCNRLCQRRVVWMQATANGADVGEPRPYGSDCAKLLGGWKPRVIGRMLRNATWYVPAKLGTENGQDMPLFAEPPAPPVVENPDYLLRQADANETWAAVLGGKRADRLNAVAAEMRRAAIAELDRQGIGYAPEPGEPEISDAELLAGLSA